MPFAARAGFNYRGTSSPPPPPPPPPTSGYRYWRILFDGVASANRVQISEIEFLNKRYYSRASGTVSASGGIGTTGPDTAANGLYNRTSVNFWSSNTGATPIWYKLDAGAGNEFTCEGVTLARANLSVNFSGFQVQYSSDNSNWTTEWTVTDVSAYSSASTGTSFVACGPPVTFTNTNITVFEPTAGFDTANVVLWLKSYDGAFTGNLTGAAANGDAVQTMTNHAGGNVLIKQTTLGNRPILRTGGAAGMPYLEFDNTLSQFFEDIAYVMPTDSTDNYPGATGILADVADPGNTTVTYYPILGNAAALIRKNILYYHNASSGDFSIMAHKSTLLAFTNTVGGLGATVHAWSTYNRNQFIDTNGGWFASTATATYSNTAQTTSQLFRTVDGGTTHYMKGKVYELILDLGTVVGNTSTDASKAQFNGYAIQQYLEGRRLYGVSPSLVDYLVVAGGGAGGQVWGGGGAGGMRTGSLSVSVSEALPVTVGAGGAGQAFTGNNQSLTSNKGSNSVFDSITASGGGGGDSYSMATPTATNGGSGGGGAFFGANGGAGGTGTSGQGSNGGSGSTSAPNYGGGGGGGKSGVGANGTSTTGGNGGAGEASSISGSSVTYAGGGGGGTYTGGTAGSGGAGGGGAGSNSGTNAAGAGTAGTANSGGGGGGSHSANNTSTSASGGSGIVIIRYLTGTMTATGGTVTTSDGYTIHTFNSSGTFTRTA